MPFGRGSSRYDADVLSRGYVCRESPLADGAVRLELAVTGTGYVGAVRDDVTIEPGKRWIGEDDVPDIEIIQEAGTGAWVIQTTYIWTEDYIRGNYRLSSVGDD